MKGTLNTSKSDNPYTGETYYDMSKNLLYAYNGNDWIHVKNFSEEQKELDFYKKIYEEFHIDVGEIREYVKEKYPERLI